MTTLKIEKIEMLAAMIGDENPLPQFRDSNPDIKVNLDDTIPQQDRQYIGWEASFRVLPHRMQDTYDGNRTPHEFTSAVLENDFIRATVLPEFGGRLISLIDKQSYTELLEPITHIQPSNIALRNAWLAGGVEWNTAQLGHHYLTCSPIFAASVTGHQGEPFLRLYAWERTKRFPYQIDMHLPSDSRFLFVRVRIINPHDYQIPMYWWSNIGVPQSSDRRTIASADSAIYNGIGSGLALADLPIIDGFDFTYATNHKHSSREMFFHISEEDRPWIASIDGKGIGLVHTSTSRLHGRKMFVWGTDHRGQRWQECLLGPGREYLEIQAGLARTQLESIPMPPETEWTWTEAFGLIQIDAAKAHSTDWSEARGSVENALESMLSRETLDGLDSQFAEVAVKVPEEILFNGDGWGSLEQMRAQTANDKRTTLPELPFSEDLLSPDQEQWLVLLRDGVLPEHDVLLSPGHYMVQPEWQALLEESIERGASNHWLGWLHLGVMKLENFDADGARKAWLRSIECKPSAWAHVNLAVLEKREKNIEAACEMLMQAWEIGPKIAPIAIECADVLEKLGRWDDLSKFVAELPETVRDNERIMIVSAKLALHYNDFSSVDRILSHEFVVIREGESTLYELWYTWQAKLISESEGIPMSDELLARARKELIPPRL